MIPLSSHDLWVSQQKINPASAVTATALCCCTFLIQSRRFSFLLLSHVSNTIFLVSHQACLETKVSSELWDHTSYHFPCSAELGHALRFGTQSCASVPVKCAVTSLTSKASSSSSKEGCHDSNSCSRTKSSCSRTSNDSGSPSSNQRGSKTSCQAWEGNKWVHQSLTKCKKVISLCWVSTTNSIEKVACFASLVKELSEITPRPWISACILWLTSVKIKNNLSQGRMCDRLCPRQTSSKFFSLTPVSLNWLSSMHWELLQQTQWIFTSTTNSFSFIFAWQNLRWHTTFSLAKKRRKKQKQWTLQNHSLASAAECASQNPTFSLSHCTCNSGASFWQPKAASPITVPPPTVAKPISRYLFSFLLLSFFFLETSAVLQGD